MSYMKFSSFKDVKDDIGSMTVQEYEKIVADMTIASNPVLCESDDAQNLYSQFIDPNNNMTIEEFMTRAIQIDIAATLPVFAVGIPPDPPINAFAAHNVAGNIPIVDGPADDAAATTPMATDATATPHLAAGATATSNLAADTTATPHLVANAAATTPMATDATATPHLAAGATATSNLAADTTATPHLVANAAATTPMATDATATPNLAADAIATPNLAADAIATPNLAADAIATPNLAADTTATPHLVADAAATTPMATDAIATPHLAAGATTTPRLVADAIATPVRTVPVAVEFDIEADLALAAQQRAPAPARLQPDVNFGDIVGEAIKRYNAAEKAANAPNSTITLPEFDSVLRDCAIGKPAPRYYGLPDDDDDDLDRTIVETPNSKYGPIPTVPTISMDEQVARNIARGNHGRVVRPPGLVKDIVTVKIQNRMDIAMCKREYVEILRKWQCEAGLNLDSAPVGTRVPAQPAQPPILEEDEEDAVEPDYSADVQAYLIHQQLVAGIPPNEIQPMNGPNAMADPFVSGEVRGNTAMQITVDGHESEALIELQAFPKPKVTGGSSWDMSVSNYVKQANARRLANRAVDLVPVNAPSEGDVLDGPILGRPRSCDEAEQRNPEYLDHMSDSDDEFVPWDADMELDDDEDIEMADQ